MRLYCRIAAIIVSFLVFGGCSAGQVAPQAGQVTTTPAAAAAVTAAPSAAATTPTAAEANEAALPKAEQQTLASGSILEREGVMLPGPDENGMRTYRWREQNVEDWLGDFDRADALRDLLLLRIDGKAKDDYYMLTLGRPVALEGGWLVPAGKRMDGEWMPTLYYVADQGSELRIAARAENYVWVLNRTAIPQEDMTSFYAIAGILGMDSDSRALRAKATFSDGTTAQVEIPRGYPYLHLTHQGDAQIVDLTCFDAVSGVQIKPLNVIDGNDWTQQEGDKRAATLLKNIDLAPLRDIDNDLSWWEDLPILNLDDQAYSASRLYAADLHDSGRKLRIYAAAPKEQIPPQQSYPLRIPANKKVKLRIDAVNWDEPTALEASLMLPNGKTKQLSVADGVIDVGILKNKGNYMVLVHAQYGEKGWIEWIAYLTR